MTIELQAHSHVGGSGAHRFGKCPASAAIIGLLKASGGNTDSPEAREGTTAHTLAAWALEHDVETWDMGAEFGAVHPLDMIYGTQTYVNYVRGLGGQQFYEIKVAMPEDAGPEWAGVRGTIDALVLYSHGAPIALELIDFKYGQGIFVSVERNWQLMYYLFVLLFGSEWPFDRVPLAMDAVCRITIVQPRGAQSDDPIRSYDITVEEIQQWGFEELRTMLITVAHEAYLSPGEHCRFCPLKLVCPAFLGVAKRIAKIKIEDLRKMAAADLADLVEMGDVIRMTANALDKEAYRRLADDQPVGDRKLVVKYGHSTWKGDAPVSQTYGEDAWKPRELRSPNMIKEAKLPGAPAFIKQWSTRPENGFVVVGPEDKRPAVKAGGQIVVNSADLEC